MPGFNALKHIFNLIEPEWHTDGYGMSHPALRFVWCYYYHFSQFFYGFHQVAYTRRRYTIIVCYKDDWLFYIFVCH